MAKATMLPILELEGLANLPVPDEVKDILGEKVRISLILSPKKKGLGFKIIVKASKGLAKKIGESGAEAAKPLLKMAVMKFIKEKTADLEKEAS